MISGNKLIFTMNRYFRKLLAYFSYVRRPFRVFNDQMLTAFCRLLTVETLFRQDRNLDRTVDYEMNSALREILKNNVDFCS